MLKYRLLSLQEGILLCINLNLEAGGDATSPGSDVDGADDGGFEEYRRNRPPLTTSFETQQARSAVEALNTTDVAVASDQNSPPNSSRNSARQTPNNSRHAGEEEEEERKS